MAYYKNVEDGGEEDVVIFGDSGYKVKTTYLLDFLRLKNKSLLFDLEFYVEEVEDVSSLMEDIKQCGVEVVLNNYPYLNCRFIFPNK